MESGEPRAELEFPLPGRGRSMEMSASDTDSGVAGSKSGCGDWDSVAEAETSGLTAAERCLSGCSRSVRSRIVCVGGGEER